jgi:hypothetical protein
VDAQAGLDPCWLQMHNVGFVMTRLNIELLSNTFKISARGELAETSLSDGEEVKLLNPCFSSIEVTSNNSDAHRFEV